MDNGFYRPVYSGVWESIQRAGFSRAAPNAETLWLYLLTASERSVIPWVILGGVGTLSDALRWDYADTERCLQELAAGDEPWIVVEGRMIYLRNGLNYRINLPRRPADVLQWRATWLRMPKGALKERIFGDMARRFAEMDMEPAAGRKTSQRGRKAGGGGGVMARQRRGSLLEALMAMAGRLAPGVAGAVAAAGPLDKERGKVISVSESNSEQCELNGIFKSSTNIDVHERDRKTKKGGNIKGGSENTNINNNDNVTPERVTTPCLRTDHNGAAPDGADMSKLGRASEGGGARREAALNGAGGGGAAGMSVIAGDAAEASATAPVEPAWAEAVERYRRAITEWQRRAWRRAWPVAYPTAEALEEDLDRIAAWVINRPTDVDRLDRAFHGMVAQHGQEAIAEAQMRTAGAVRGEGPARGRERGGKQGGAARGNKGSVAQAEMACLSGGEVRWVSVVPEPRDGARGEAGLWARVAGVFAGRPLGAWLESVRCEGFGAGDVWLTVRTGMILRMIACDEQHVEALIDEATRVRGAPVRVWLRVEAEGDDDAVSRAQADEDGLRF